MDKLKELLAGKGFGDEDITKIADAIVEAKYVPENYIPKSRFDEVNNQKNDYEKQIKTFTEQIDGLKKSAGDNEALKQQIEELKKAQEDALAESEKKIKELYKEQAIKSMFANDVYDVDYIYSKLDTNLIHYDENTKKVVSGLKEQLDSLKQNEVTKIQFKTNSGVTGGYVPQEGSGANPAKNEVSSAEDRIDKYLATKPKPKE